MNKQLAFMVVVGPNKCESETMSPYEDQLKFERGFMKVGLEPKSGFGDTFRV